MTGYHRQTGTIRSLNTASGFVILALAAGSMPAWAGQFPPAPEEIGITAPSIATSLPDNGDTAGVRRWLYEHGTAFTLLYTNDVLSNISGGRKRGTIDQGLAEARLSFDLDKMAGLQNWAAFANVYQIHNTGRIRRDYVGGLNTIAAIEADPTTRLSELWVEYKLPGKGSLRVGQLAADTEFFFSDLSVMFLQSDWPTIAAGNLPSGGPAYPLSTPGARLKVEATPGLTALVAVLNGDPAGPGIGDEQARNRYGTNFRTSDATLVIGELQYHLPQTNPTALATTLKAGAWRHQGDFADQRVASDGLLRADPASIGTGRPHQGNYGLYGIVDQQLYRLPGEEAGKGISVFGRVSSSPADRNAFETYADGGLVFAGLVPGRPDDKFGIAAMYARFSDSLRAFERDQNRFGTATRVQDYEANLELTYVAQIIPGWTLQPDAQYVRHPNGQTGMNAKVAGVRTILRF